MKTTVFATMLAAGSLTLAVPGFAAEDPPAAAAEAPVAADSVAVTTVIFKGGG